VGKGAAPWIRWWGLPVLGVVTGVGIMVFAGCFGLLIAGVLAGDWWPLDPASEDDARNRSLRMTPEADAPMSGARRR